MIFDYIIGNPPYQTSEKKKISSKLYVQIVHRMIDHYRDEMIFITPRPIILPGGLNKNYKHIKEYVCAVKDTSKYFNENTNSIYWKISKKKSSGKIRYNNNDVDELWECYTIDAKDFYLDYMKISPKFNNRKKLMIRASHSPLRGYRGVMEDRPFDNSVQVVHQRKGKEEHNRLHKYVSREKINHLSKKDKLIVAYASKWFPPWIGNDILSEYFGVVEEKDYPNQLQNIKSFMSTDTIKNYVISFSKMTGSNYYNALWQIPELDFSRAWTDKEVREELKLDEEHKWL